MKKLIFAAAILASASFVIWGTAGLSETIPMISDGGTFRVPVTINGQLTLNFVIDSGAADVSVPADVVMTLLRTGTITDADFLGKQTYRLADGSTVPSQQFVIRSLKVGDETLENVVGSIAPVAGGLLLGQSFLSRFNTWSIDNHRQALILGSPPLVVVNPPPAPSYGVPYSYPVNLNPNGDNWLALRTELMTVAAALPSGRRRRTFTQERPDVRLRGLNLRDADARLQRGRLCRVSVAERFGQRAAVESWKAKLNP